MMGALTVAGCPRLEGQPPIAGETLGFNVPGEPTPVVVAGEPVCAVATVCDVLAGKAGHHAPTIAALADGELLAAWYSYDGPGELEGADLYVARRRPGDAGWSAPAVLVDRTVAVGNPVLYSEGEVVWLFYAVVPGGGWGTVHVEHQRSDDRGLTWSAPRVLGGGLGMNVRYPPVRTAGGELLLPAYNDLVPRAVFFASGDGDTWRVRSEMPVDLAHAQLQPCVAPLADGRLLAVFRNGGRGWLWVSTSADGGRDWSTPADSGLPNPGSPAALARLASGNLVLVFNDSDTVRRPLAMTISADEGRMWHPSRVLVDGPGEYAYPSLVQTPDGLLHVVYSHERARIEHIALNEAWLAQ